MGVGPITPESAETLAEDPAFLSRYVLLAAEDRTDGEVPVWNESEGIWESTGAAGTFATAQSINAQTGTSYGIVAGDVGYLVTLSNASAISLTVPQDSDQTISVGSYVDLMQLGAGQVTVSAGTGATLRVSGLTAKARAQYSRLGVQKIAANTWVVFGDLAAS